MTDLPNLQNEMTDMFVLGLLAFAVAMLLTPIYTGFAYRHKLWKNKRDTATTGEALNIVKKLSTRKRRVPTMAGVIVVVSTVIVTVLFNLSREQTWLPLAALIGGGVIGLIDDIINVRGNGHGVAGLRAPIKFAMLIGVAAIGAWFFYFKLGYDSIHIPWIGDLTLGWLLIPLFILAVVSAGNAVNISDGLDGLAGGLLMSAYMAFGVIAAVQGNFGIAAFCVTVAGGLLA